MKMPAPGDVYVVVDLTVGQAGYRRPCIVISWATDSTIEVAPLSTQFDMYDCYNDFCIDSDDISFGSTGLNKSCYAIGSKLATIEVSQLVTRRGRLSGDMLNLFLEWAG